MTASIRNLLKSAHTSRMEEIPILINLRPHKHAITLLTQNKLAKWKSAKRAAKANAPFQVIDFFCGAGGMSAGFAALSRVVPFFKLIGGCDINADAVATYERNLGAVGVQADVRRLADDPQALTTFLQGLDGYNPRTPTIIIGCAPCQGFSSHRKRRWNEADERNPLVGDFARLAVRLRPRCIVMENVPEFLSEKYWSYFEEARQTFAAAGYVVHQAIYNVAAFGVPQERFRSLVVAMRRDHVLPDAIYDLDEFVSVRRAIGHLPSVEPGLAHPDDPLHRCAEHRSTTVDVIRAVPKDGGSRPFGVGPKCLDRVKGYYDVYGRLHWDKPAITITHYARNPASGRYTHPEQNRGLTAREAALLQGFPMGWKFEGTFDSVFKQIGEAVPPTFSCAVAASVLAELLSPAVRKIDRVAAVESVTTPVNDSYSSVIAGMKRSRVMT